MLILLPLAFAVPQHLSHQGVLYDMNGQPLEGTHGLVFRLFDSDSGGSELWSEQHSPTFTAGHYQAQLGETTPLDSSIFDQSPLWLELEVDGLGPLEPRYELGAVPFAVIAEEAEALLPGSDIDANSITIGDDLVIDSSGLWPGEVAFDRIVGRPTMLGDLMCSEIGQVVSWNGSSFECSAHVSSGSEGGLGELSCAAGEIVSWNGTEFQCVAAQFLSESEVEAMITNGAVDLASGTTVGGSELVAQPGACTDGQVLVYSLADNAWACGEDTDTTLTAGEVQAMVEAVSGLALAAGATVGGSPILSEDSTLNPANIDATGATDGQVLAVNGGVPSWTTAGCQVVEQLNGQMTAGKTVLNCDGVEFVVSGGTRRAIKFGHSEYYNYEFCAIDQSNEIFCWGVTQYHDYCQDPRCSEVPSGAFKEVVLSNFSSYGACAIDMNDSIQCWANDNMAAIPSGSYSEIAGGQFFCALSTLGEIECWSGNSDSLGFSVPHGAGHTGIVVLGSNGCALDVNNEIVCWGTSNQGLTSPPAGTFTQVSLGSSNACALNTNQRAECWGNGSLSPPDIDFVKVVMVNNNDACGLSSNGVVTCWGGSDLATGELYSDIEFSGALCGLTLDGNLKCWDYIDVVLEGPFVDFIASSVNPCGLTASGVIHCLRSGVP